MFHITTLLPPSTSAERLCQWSGSRCRCPVRLVHRHSASHSFRTEGVTPQQSYHPPPSPTHAPRPRPACRMIARVREIRHLSDASRLGSLKNKSSCAGLRRSLSFRRYPFPSHASSAKVLCVSPPLGPCAALVGAGVLNKSRHWSLFTAGAQYVSVDTNTKHGDALALSLSHARTHELRNTLQELIISAAVHIPVSFNQ